MLIYISFIILAVSFLLAFALSVRLSSPIENLTRSAKELSQGNGMGPWVHPVRVAVSGRMEGPGLFEMLELLGKARTVARLRLAAERL